MKIVKTIVCLLVLALFFASCTQDDMIEMDAFVQEKQRIANPEFLEEDLDNEISTIAHQGVSEVIANLPQPSEADLVVEKKAIGGINVVEVSTPVIKTDEIGK